MSVETLQRLHGRYAALSGRFRATWAFHQFAESLAKFVPGTPRNGDLAPECQRHSGALKSISARLNAEEPAVIEAELDAVEEELGRLTSALAEEDSRVSPQVVRHFFQRVKNEDENLLTQLVKFYLYAGGSADWPEDRLDKVDFLLTRVAQELDSPSDRYVLRERTRLRESATGLWSLLGAEPPLEAVADGAVAELRELRGAVAASETLDRLNEGRLVERFRELKHGLGRHFLFPRILYEILETNLVFKNLVRQLYSVEERRITADYQRVFDLEREAVVDGELDGELRRFRGEVEAFERQLREDELRLQELARLRERVRSLSARLGGPGAREDAAPRAPSVEAAAEDEARGDDLLAEAMARLSAALREADPDLPPRRAVLVSELFPLRLEARELVAYRRLHGADAGDGRDPGLERTILEAAALRVAINRRVEEIRGLLDETATTGESPMFPHTRRLLRLAASYLARLEAAAEQAVLYGRAADA
ncbi:MAG TPA: hypothetical protein VLF66_14610, partial [Thermoanaerobaculia bacterium]|nr:hypothetical protein [Thermoanaerobaculia bacterium]